MRNFENFEIWHERSRSSPKSKDDEKNEKLTKKQKLERRRAKLKAWREEAEEETKTKIDVVGKCSKSSNKCVFLSFFFILKNTHTHLFNTCFTFILCDPFLPISTHSLTNSSNAYSNYYHYTDPFSRRSLPRRRRRKMRSWRRRRRMRWIRWRLT